MFSSAAPTIEEHLFTVDCTTSCYDAHTPSVSVVFSNREGAVLVARVSIYSLALRTCQGLVFTCFYSASLSDAAYVRLSRAQLTRYITICFDPETRLFYTMLTPTAAVIRCLKRPEPLRIRASAASNTLLYLSYLNIPKKSLEYNPRRLSKRTCLFYNFRRFVSRYQHYLLATTTVVHTDHLFSAPLYAIGARVKNRYGFKPVDENAWDRLPLKRLKTKPSPVFTQTTRLLRFLQDLLNLLNSVLGLQIKTTNSCFLCSCGRVGSCRTAIPTGKVLLAARYINSIISLSKYVLAAANISSRTCGVLGSTRYRGLLPSPLVHARAAHIVSTLLESRRVLAPLDFETIARSIVWRRYIYHARRRNPRNRRAVLRNTQSLAVFFLFSQFFTLVSSFSHFIRIGAFYSALPLVIKGTNLRNAKTPIVIDNCVAMNMRRQGPHRKLFLMNTLYSAVPGFLETNKYQTHVGGVLTTPGRAGYKHRYTQTRHVAKVARYPHTRFKLSFVFCRKKKRVLGPFFRKIFVL